MYWPISEELVLYTLSTYLLFKEMQRKRIIEMDVYCIFIASFNLNFHEGISWPFQVVLHWTATTGLFSDSEAQTISIHIKFRVETATEIRRKMYALILNIQIQKFF